MSRPNDFWSRRKAKVLEEQHEEARAAEQCEVAEREAALEKKSDEEVLQELGLPDPDTLQPGDNVKAFMAEAVPDRIRRRALRKLWLSNPALANLDGLLDYGEDFTNGATVVENLQTAYQVGKGMLKHVEELARQASAKDAQVESGQDQQQDPETELQVDETLAAEDSDQQMPPPEPVTLAYDDPSQEEPVALPRRRMRFSFETTQEAQV